MKLRKFFKVTKQAKDDLGHAIEAMIKKDFEHGLFKSLLSPKTLMYVIALDRINGYQCKDVIWVSDELGKALNFNPIGMKCFKAFYNRDIPCEDCKNKEIMEQKGVPYVWIKYNDLLDQVFVVIDVYKELEGRPIKIEFAVDVSEEEENIRMQFFKKSIERGKS